MTESSEELLRQLVALSRQQLALQEAASARQVAMMAGLRRRTVISAALLLAGFALVAYVVHLAELMRYRP